MDEIQISEEEEARIRQLLKRKREEREAMALEGSGDDVYETERIP